MKTEKTTCPLTAVEFAEHARPLQITIGDKHTIAMVKEFTTGSFGWYLNDKLLRDNGEVG